VGIVFGVEDDAHRMGPLDRLAFGQKPKPLPTPLADGDEIVAGRGPIFLPLDLDHGRLHPPLASMVAAAWGVFLAFFGEVLSLFSGLMIWAPCKGSLSAIRNASNGAVPAASVAVVSMD